MMTELKRPYFITPSLFIELVKGYAKLLVEKQGEYSAEIKKLALGLHKLFTANEKSKALE
jgi:dynein heavy chain